MARHDNALLFLYRNRYPQDGVGDIHFETKCREEDADRLADTISTLFRGARRKMSPGSSWSPDGTVFLEQVHK